MSAEHLVYWFCTRSDQVCDELIYIINEQNCAKSVFLLKSKHVRLTHLLDSVSDRKVSFLAFDKRMKFSDEQISCV